MVVAVFITIAIISYGYKAFDELGRFDSLCCPKLRTMHIWHFIGLYLTPTVLAYAVSIFSAVKIHRLITDYSRNAVMAVTMRSQISDGENYRILYQSNNTG